MNLTTLLSLSLPLLLWEKYLRDEGERGKGRCKGGERKGRQREGTRVNDMEGKGETEVMKGEERKDWKEIMRRKRKMRGRRSEGERKEGRGNERRRREEVKSKEGEKSK